MTLRQLPIFHWIPSEAISQVVLARFKVALDIAGFINPQSSHIWGVSLRIGISLIITAFSDALVFFKSRLDITAASRHTCVGKSRCPNSDDKLHHNLSVLSCFTSRRGIYPTKPDLPRFQVRNISKKGWTQIMATPINTKKWFDLLS